MLRCFTVVLVASLALGCDDDSAPDERGLIVVPYSSVSPIKPEPTQDTSSKPSSTAPSSPADADAGAVDAGASTPSDAGDAGGETDAAPAIDAATELDAAIEDATTESNADAAVANDAGPELTDEANSDLGPSRDAAVDSGLDAAE